MRFPMAFRALFVGLLASGCLIARLTLAAEADDLSEVESCPKDLTLTVSPSPHWWQAPAEWWRVSGGIILYGELDGHPIASVRGLAGVGRVWRDRIRAMSDDLARTEERSIAAAARNRAAIDRAWERRAEERARLVHETIQFRDDLSTAWRPARAARLARWRTALSDGYAEVQARISRWMDDFAGGLFDWYLEGTSTRWNRFGDRRRRTGEDQGKWREAISEGSAEWQRQLWADFNDPNRVAERNRLHSERQRVNADYRSGWTLDRRQHLQDAMRELEETARSREESLSQQWRKDVARLGELAQYKLHRDWSLEKLGWLARNWEELGAILKGARESALDMRRRGAIAHQMDTTHGQVVGSLVRSLRQVQAAGELVIVGAGGTSLAAIGSAAGYPLAFFVSAGSWVLYTGTQAGAMVVYGGVARGAKNFAYNIGEGFLYSKNAVSWTANEGLYRLAQGYAHLAYVGSMIGNGFKLTALSTVNYAGARGLLIGNDVLWFGRTLGNPVAWVTTEGAALGTTLAGAGVVTAAGSFGTAMNFGVLVAGSSLNYGIYATSWTAHGILWGGITGAAGAVAVGETGLQVFGAGLRHVLRFGGDLVRVVGLGVRGAARVSDAAIVTTANTVTTPLFTAATLGWTVLDQAAGAVANTWRSIRYPAFRFTVPLDISIDEELFERIPAAADLLERKLSESFDVERAGDEYGTVLTMYDKESREEVGQVEVITRRRRLELNFALRRWYVDTFAGDGGRTGRQERASRRFLEVAAASVDLVAVETVRLGSKLADGCRVEVDRRAPEGSSVILFDKQVDEESAAPWGHLDFLHDGGTFHGVLSLKPESDRVGTQGYGEGTDETVRRRLEGLLGIPVALQQKGGVQ